MHNQNENEQELQGADDNSPELDSEEQGQNQERGGGEHRGARFWFDMLGRTRTPGEASELIAEDVVTRSQRAPIRLMSQLYGTIDLAIDRPKKLFQFEWKDPAKAALDTPTVGTDCTIEISEETLLRIAAGDINPQVAMLSDKIRVTGKASLAMYFFNLVAPVAMSRR